jgi:hypothetical protein
VSFIPLPFSLPVICSRQEMACNHCTTCEMRNGPAGVTRINFADRCRWLTRINFASSLLVDVFCTRCAENKLAFLGTRTKLPLYCRHIEWDEAESSDGAAAVVNWAQFRQDGQIRDKPMSSHSPKRWNTAAAAAG